MVIGTRSSLTDRNALAPCERNDQNIVLPMGDGDQVPDIDKQIQPTKTTKKQSVAKSNSRKRKYDEVSDLENSPVRKRSKKKKPSKKGKSSRKKKQRSSSPARSVKRKKTKNSQSYTAANKQGKDESGNQQSADDSGEIRGMSASPKILLVLDTNILLGSGGLRFLEDLAEGKYDVPGLPPMQIHIPHVVFLELDRQKSRKGTAARDVGQRAGAAVRFLHSQMVDHRRLPQPIASTTSLPTARSDAYIPRFAGQTARDFARAGKDFQQELDDDHVLFCCLQLQERLSAQSGAAAAVWCMTNDCNLRIRTVVNGVPAFSLWNILDNIELRRAGGVSIFDSL